MLSTGCFLASAGSACRSRCPWLPPGPPPLLRRHPARLSTTGKLTLLSMVIGASPTCSYTLHQVCRFVEAHNTCNKSFHSDCVGKHLPSSKMPRGLALACLAATLGRPGRTHLSHRLMGPSQLPTEELSGDCTGDMGGRCSHEGRQLTSPQEVLCMRPDRPCSGMFSQGPSLSTRHREKPQPQS